MGEASLVGELKNQVGSGADNLLIALELGQRKALDIIPTIAGNRTAPAVEAICLVRLLYIYVARAVGLHFGMSDLRAIGQRHKRVCHSFPQRWTNGPCRV